MALHERSLSPQERFILWVAQGFGAGRAKLAPGTVGTLPGIAWQLLLMAPGNYWIFLGGTCLGLGVAFWICGRAERILDEADPGSVVMDEIAAWPVCFLGWSVLPGAELSLRFFATSPGIGLVVAGFGLFRLFDIWKPWPANVSQRLPGGWGVVMDDLIAAVYTGLVLMAGWGGIRAFF